MPLDADPPVDAAHPGTATSDTPRRRGWAETLRALVTAVRDVPKATKVKIGVFLVAVVIIGSLIDVPDMATLRAWPDKLGPWFVPTLWAAYVAFTLLPIPRTIWTVASGVLLGPWKGLALALTALTVSASLAFLGVRAAFGRDTEASAARQAKKNPAAARMHTYLEERGWVAIFNLRMVAGVPFSLLNYAAALTPIPLHQFAIATLVGSIPTTALGVFFGDALTGTPSPWILATMAILAVVGIAGVVLDGRRALAPAAEAPTQPTTTLDR